jgi:hypothetical protein
MMAFSSVQRAVFGDFVMFDCLSDSKETSLQSPVL